MTKSIEEALEDVKAKKNANGNIVINRFSKKKFNALALAVANDVNYKSEVAKVIDGQPSIEEVMVTKGFRKFCKKLLQSAGVDKSEAVRVEDGDFKIESIDGLYEFFTEVMYLYMNAGNKFDLPTREDFQGSLMIKEIGESKSTYEAFNPKDRTPLGKYEKTNKKHKELKARSTTPKWLSKKRKLK